MAVDVVIKPNDVDIGAVHPLGIPVVLNRLRLYDASADGQRFLVAMPQQHKASVPLTLVQNWTARLKKD